MASPYLEAEGVVVDDWIGLYKESWTGVITPEAFAHPAKFSRALIRAIYDHVRDEGWAVVGDSVVDPFGGVALGGFDAMRQGLNWYGCELEAKFVGLGNQNIALWNERFSRMPKWGTARLVQGDSRKLAEVLRQARRGSRFDNDDAAEYAQNTGISLEEAKRRLSQISSESLSEDDVTWAKENSAACCVSSPPYNLPFSQDHNGSRGGKRSNGTAPSSERGAFHVYGNTPGQLEGLSSDGFDVAISSPPFSQPETRDRAPVQDGNISDCMTRAYTVDRQSQTEGNLAAMPLTDFDVAVSSPPYEGSEGSPSLGSVNKDDWGKDGRDITARRGLTAKYGEADGQMGHTTGDTFWSASHLNQLHVVAERSET